MGKKIIARSQASCGEFIQGIIGGKELIVSCPIDMYSYACVEVDGPIYPLAKKAKEAAVRTLDFIGEKKEVLDRLSIQVNSDIPVGKGMGSSTADIAAVCTAVAAVFGVQLESTELSRIAVSIEPTDSTIFDKITLFDSRNGTVIEPLGKAPDMYVIVLEGRDRLDTIEFHKIKKHSGHPLDEAYRLLRSGIEKGSVEDVASASTMSALNNQRILPKPYIDFILDSAISRGAAGITVAHTGTSIGVLVDGRKGDIERIEDFFVHSHITDYYKVYGRKIINSKPEVV